MSRPIPEARTAAHKAGELTYIGHVCAQGHSPERYTTSGRCIGCSKAATKVRIRDRRTAVSFMGGMPTFVMLKDWRVVTP